MEYKLKDGGVINASTPDEFVTELRKSSRFDSECTNEEYMINFAERFAIQSGETLSTESPESFLESLQKTDFIL